MFMMRRKYSALPVTRHKFHAKLFFEPLLRPTVHACGCADREIMVFQQ